MRLAGWIVGAALALSAFAAPAWAGGDAPGACAPSTREVQAALDAYLAADGEEPVVACETAGYDGGFWLKGGSHLLKVNLTIQTRFEYFDWDDRAVEPSPGGDLSGFSLPRLTLKLSGDVLCHMHYYAELEFGHHGQLLQNERGADVQGFYFVDADFNFFNHAYDDGGLTREAWLECRVAQAFAVRMGLVKLPTTRQLMTPPEMQQFVDVSLASAFVGIHVPGWTDRNRDYGLLLHGSFGCRGELSYLVGITNGDGPVHRNVLDGTTDDNLAYSGRVNWDVLGAVGYEEGALRQRQCGWVASVGAFGYVFHDTHLDHPHQRLVRRTVWGVDGAVGYGGFSLTAAFTSTTLDESDFFTGALDGTSWLVQAGYLFPDSAFEVAARYSAYQEDTSSSGGGKFGAAEWAVALNYFVDGHGSKLTVDASFLTPEDDGNVLGDVYAGYAGATQDSDAMLLRFQWQLAL